MSVSKSVRFEVFARDGFSCQYCGQRPPDVVLELDHIHPRAKGGGDEILNLLTSCYECNRGKAAKVLSEVSPRPDADLMFLRVQQEIAEATRYLEAKQHRDYLLAQQQKSLEGMWELFLDCDSPEVHVWHSWITKYGADEVELAIDKCATKARYSDIGRGSPYTKMVNCSKYISGVLRKRREDTNG